jgi:hypothetical protein
MAVQTLTTMKALANAMARGNLRAGADAVRSLMVGEPYVSNAGTPVAVVTPEAIGQRLFDSTNLVFYRATGLTSSDWALDSGGNAIVAAGATLTLSKAKHDGRTIMLDTAAGSVVTLPAASGTGAVYKFVVKVLATSNSHIVKVANASDIIQGVITTIDSDTAGTVTGWATAATDDTVTLNRSTTGSTIRGEWFEIQDIATNLFAVKGQLANTGNGATPFSATV